jgi:hypothetical protein
MNVMIIPEDFRMDQFILQPIVTAMLAALGKPRAKVEVCLDPLLGGISRAMDAGELAQIVNDRPMVDLFLLIVDRDGEAGRRLALNHLETTLLPKVQKAGGAFLGEMPGRKLRCGRLRAIPSCLTGDGMTFALSVIQRKPTSNRWQRRTVWTDRTTEAESN